MKNLANNVVVITGAASGMGRELAIQLADLGCRLAISDVNEEELQKTLELISGNKSQIRTDKLNVADEAAVRAYVDTVIDEFGCVDRVINNAGIAVTDSIKDVSMEEFRLIMDVNFWGVVYGTKFFLPHLLEREEASVVNISSVNAFIPFPHNGPYNCSKYAVCGFNETMHQELEGTNVRLLSVHPGGIKTNIARNSLFHKGPNPKASKEKVVAEFDRITMTSASKAATKIIEAMANNKKRLMIGPDAYVFEYFKRLAPQLSVSLMSKLASR